ncbi:MAG: hypothetical protein IIT61_03245 [Bacteroidales bacterium]|nr:hypothetical protein [Bacteroidales bacterium]MBQ2350850.1 hypothetical protein [Bacteroidales bacterium]MBQ2573983.1 hypothetical protein [Bacteroidales bacterium]MBQ5424919.1 hypothetical protein [Bacteroidales bacterium]MBQ5457719.1 hypothetical protein [Bacteroidales bacterium]
MNEQKSALDNITSILSQDWNGKIDNLKSQMSDMSWGSVEITIEPKSIFLLFGSLTVSVALILLLWWQLKK